MVGYKQTECWDKGEKIGERERERRSGLSLALSRLYTVLRPLILREENREDEERALDDQTHDWSHHRSIWAHSRRWERGRRNSGQLSPATALTRREPWTHFLPTDPRDLGRSFLSRPIVTSYYKPVHDMRATRTGRRVLRLRAAQTSINPCVFLHYHPPLNAHPRESLAGAKKHRHKSFNIPKFNFLSFNFKIYRFTAIFCGFKQF